MATNLSNKDSRFWRGRSESHTPELIQVIAVAVTQSRVMTTAACSIEQ